MLQGIAIGNNPIGSTPRLPTTSHIIRKPIVQLKTRDLANENLLQIATTHPAKTNPHVIQSTAFTAAEGKLIPIEENLSIHCCLNIISLRRNSDKLIRAPTVSVARTVCFIRYFWPNGEMTHRFSAAKSVDVHRLVLIFV